MSNTNDSDTASRRINRLTPTVSRRTLFTVLSLGYLAFVALLYAARKVQRARTG